ncbi:hypothetical protein [Streptomyces sp. A1547]|nr:hypothetical protein [Streptomyces sp. A1547]
MDKAPRTSRVGAVGTPERKPPVAGAIWCNSCSAWCLPSGICRCNNR